MPKYALHAGGDRERIVGVAIGLFWLTGARSPRGRAPSAPPTECRPVDVMTASSAQWRAASQIPVRQRGLGIRDGDASAAIWRRRTQARRRPRSRPSAVARSPGGQGRDTHRRVSDAPRTFRRARRPLQGPRSAAGAGSGHVTLQRECDALTAQADHASTISVVSRLGLGDQLGRIVRRPGQITLICCAAPRHQRHMRES